MAIRTRTWPRRRRRATGRSAFEEAFPLAALVPILDERSEATRWRMRPDQLPGRWLLIERSGAYSVALQPGGQLSLRTRVMLVPHDWRDHQGSVLATIHATDASGRERQLWSTVLTAMGPSRGTPVALELPAETRQLTLAVHPHTPATPPAAPGSWQRPPVNRAIFHEPTLIDPTAPPPRPATPSTPTTAPPPPGDPPRISVLTPVHDPPLQMLREAIDSVLAQTYPNWELCLVDDGSTHTEITAELDRYATADPRIKLTRHPTAGGISQATNTALNDATGDYIALLDHDDTLAPDALQQIADTLTTQPDLDMIYTDEDIVVDGRRIWVHHKPAWSLDTLRTNGYTCHLGVYRRTLVRDLGGFRDEFNGSQDVDMILRLVERTDRIAHVPQIAYHWRAHAASTAGGDAKPYAYVAARNAIAEHLARTGVRAEVGYGPPGLYRVMHEVASDTTVALVLAAPPDDALAGAAASWVAQPHHAWTVIIAAPAAAAARAAEVLMRAGIAERQIATVPVSEPDPVIALAQGARAAQAEHLLLMQAPASGITHDWLTRLVGYAAQDGIGAAGPVVLAPDGRIRQAGVALPDGIPLHLLNGERSSMDHLFGYGTSVYNVSAVGGVIATRRELYERLGGLDREFGELALVDYCIRAGDAGLRNVIVPDARVRIATEATNDLAAIRRLRARWRQRHNGDPFYNPHYRTDRGDFQPVS
jgi:GT2 family glycosyltransferase